MDDFPSNSRKAREEVVRPKPEVKNVEKVVSGNVVRRKPPLGRRLFETFFSGDDAKTVFSYLVMDVLIPSAKDIVADMFDQGAKRFLYGDSRSRSRREGYSGPTGYVSYNRITTSSSPARESEYRARMSRQARSQHNFDEIIFQTRIEAETVLDRLYDLIGRYQMASVGDFYDVVGEDKTPVDEKWGWSSLQGANIRKIRGGYLIDLPRPEHFE